MATGGQAQTSWKRAGLDFQEAQSERAAELTAPKLDWHRPIRLSFQPAQALIQFAEPQGQADTSILEIVSLDVGLVFSWTIPPPADPLLIPL